MLNKKAQEEIVGFVLIMILVSVIFMVFLGITLRNPSTSERKSETAYQFLESSMEQTSDCAIFSRPNLLNLEDLISECFSSDSDCSNGQSSCESLNETVGSLLNSSWRYGEDYPLKGYSFESIYNVNSTTGLTSSSTILNILEGNCNGSLVGNSYW